MTTVALKKIFALSFLLITLTIFSPLVGARRVWQNPAEKSYHPKNHYVGGKTDQNTLQQMFITAIRNNSLDGMQKAVQAGVWCFLADDTGLTPFMIACKNHATSIDIIKFMCTYGGDPNIGTSDTGMTALMFACDARLGEVNLDAVETLLQNCGNRHVLDKEKHSAIWYAVEGNNQRLLNLFFRWHAIVDDLLLEQTISSPLHRFLVAYKQISDEIDLRRVAVPDDSTVDLVTARAYKSEH